MTYEVRSDGVTVWVDSSDRFTVAHFGRLGIDAVIALAEPANVASLRVLEKVGMQRTGERTAFGRPHFVYRRAAAA